MPHVWILGKFSALFELLPFGPAGLRVGRDVPRDGGGSGFEGEIGARQHYQHSGQRHHRQIRRRTFDCSGASRTCPRQSPQRCAGG